MSVELQLSTFTFRKAFDLGDYGARRCGKCGKAIRYAILLQSPNGIKFVVGPECATHVRGASTIDQANIERYIAIENNRPALAQKELPEGFIVPPLPAANIMMAPVVPRLRFSIMTNIEPQRIHDTGWCWSACSGEDCAECAEGINPVAKVYPVCVWNLTGRGTLYVPDNFPFGCTRFRGLALRDGDVAVMEELTKGRDIKLYEWRIDVHRAGRNRKYVIQRIATSGLNFVRSYIENVSLTFSEPIVGKSTRKWASDVLPPSRTLAEIAAEEEEMQRLNALAGEEWV